MRREVEVSAEILFDLVTSLEPRLKTLSVWYFDTLATISKWEESEGSHGIKRAKDIMGQAWLLILGETTEPLSYVATEKSVPKLVKPLVDRVKSLKLDARLLSAVLSITRVTDLWEGQATDAMIEKQLEVINDSTLPATAKKVITEFEIFLEKFLKSNPSFPIVYDPRKKGIRPKIRIQEKYESYYTESRGPNGPLTEAALLDHLTVTNYKCSDGVSLGDHIKRLEDGLCHLRKGHGYSAGNSLSNLFITHYGQDYLEKFKYSQEPGKLGFIGDKSGKVRVIAEPDYWSQLSLRPIHDYLMDILKDIPEDFAHNQGAAIPRISEWHRRGAYVASFDQSSCTDLFPFDLQLAVLKTCTSEEVTEATRVVMADRIWKAKLPSGKLRHVRWSVGQPQGMFASWPLMALTHHMLVQYCYWLVLGKPVEPKVYRSYAICGDDIVIAGRNVSTSYTKVVKLLGMKVNLAKSHIHEERDPNTVSEFAKVVIWKGLPLTPVRPHMVLASVKDWKFAIRLLSDLATSEHFKLTLKKARLVVKKHYTRWYRFLEPLLTIRQEIGGVGFTESRSLRSRFDQLDIGEIHPMLWYIAERIRRKLTVKITPSTYTSYDGWKSEVLMESPLFEIVRGRKPLLWPPNDSHLRTSSIARELIINGYSQYAPFIQDAQQIRINAPSPWDEKQEEDKESSLLWIKALEKKHYFNSADLKTLETLGFGYKTYDNCDSRAPIAERQCDVVVRYLHEMISNKRHNLAS